MRNGKTSVLLAVGTIILLIFLIFSLFPELVAPYSLKEMSSPWQGISAEHLLGTNDMGYDIFTEIIYAARSTLAAGITAAAVSLVIGVAVGLAAGYTTGWKAELARGTINVFMLIPMLPAAAVTSAFLGPGLQNTVLVISLLAWCPTARAVRARAASLRRSPFVESLYILQIPRHRIILRHILPNLTEVVLARYILSVSSCMMTEAALSFIGLGDPSNVTWGGMANLAYRNGGFLRGAYNWFFAPGLCVALCALAFTCVNAWFERRFSSVDGGEPQSLSQ